MCVLYRDSILSSSGGAYVPQEGSSEDGQEENQQQPLTSSHGSRF